MLTHNQEFYKFIKIFVKELIKAQTNNPVFILDEIDKIQKGK